MVILPQVIYYVYGIMHFVTIYQWSGKWVLRPLLKFGKLASIYKLLFRISVGAAGDNRNPLSTDWKSGVSPRARQHHINFLFSPHVLLLLEDIALFCSLPKNDP